MEGVELAALKEMHIVAFTKNSDQETGLKAFFDDKTHEFDILDPDSINKNLVKSINPQVIIFCGVETGSIGFLKTLFPKSYIIHVTDSENAEYLKTSVNLGTSRFISKGIIHKALEASLANPIRTFILDKKLIATSKNFKKITNNLSGIVCVTDGRKVFWGNRGFNELFNISTLKEFNQKISYLSSIFITKKGFLSYKERDDWLKDIESKAEKKRKVAIRDKKGKIETFLVDITDFSDEPFRKIVTLFPVSREIIQNTSRLDEHSKSWQTVVDSLEIEIIRSDRYDINFSSIFIDIIDRFGKGEPVDDPEVVSFVHEEILEILRHTDYCVQMGVSQFVLIASHTDQFETEKLCKRIIENLQGLKENFVNSCQFKFAVTGYKVGDTPLKIMKRLNHGSKETVSKNPFEIIKV